MTVFEEHKWLFKKIDRLRRSFLWRGETPDKVYGVTRLSTGRPPVDPKSKEDWEF
jgi:hypothetical protein